MFVRHYSESVTLLTQEVSQLSKTESTNLTQNGIIIKQMPVRDFSVNDQDIGVTLADGQYLQFDTLYVALGTSANSKLARMVGANLSESACIVVDEHQQTTISGLFAAGDIVEGLDQIAVASGQAAKAATAIHNRLSS